MCLRQVRKFDKFLTTEDERKAQCNGIYTPRKHFMTTASFLCLFFYPEERVLSTGTSVNSYQTTRRSTPHASSLHSDRCEELKPLSQNTVQASDAITPSAGRCLSTVAPNYMNNNHAAQQFSRGCRILIVLCNKFTQ
jgi:hypothetical protein